MAVVEKLNIYKNSSMGNWKSGCYREVAIVEKTAYAHIELVLDLICFSIPFLLKCITADFRGYYDNIFLFSPRKTYVVGTHWKRLSEALPMSTHNIRFNGEIRKMSIIFW